MQGRLHDVLKAYNCEICTKTFSMKGLYTDHIKKHVPSSRFECTECLSHFKWPGHLKSHMKAVHARKDKQSYKCKLCAEVFTDMPALVKHRNKEHVKQLSVQRCKICNQICSSKSNVKWHVQSTHVKDFKRSKCPYCPSDFKWLHHLKGHIKKKHIANGHVPTDLIKKGLCSKSSNNKCVVCMDRFTNKLDLLLHLRNSHRQEVDIFKCCLCQSVFGDSNSLRVHLALHRRQTETGNHKCDQCHPVFTPKPYFEVGSYTKYEKPNSDVQKEIIDFEITLLEDDDLRRLIKFRRRHLKKSSFYLNNTDKCKNDGDGDEELEGNEASEIRKEEREEFIKISLSQNLNSEASSDNTIEKRVANKRTKSLKFQSQIHNSTVPLIDTRSYRIAEKGATKRAKSYNELCSQIQNDGSLDISRNTKKINPFVLLMEASLNQIERAKSHDELILSQIHNESAINILSHNKKINTTEPLTEPRSNKIVEKVNNKRISKRAKSDNELFPQIQSDSTISIARYTKKINPIVLPRDASLECSTNILSPKRNMNSSIEISSKRIEDELSHFRKTSKELQIKLLRIPIEQLLSLGTALRQLQCDYCSKLFNSNVDLGKHLKLKHKAKLLKCDICKTKVSNEETAKENIYENDPLIADKPYICKNCSDSNPGYAETELDNAIDTVKVSEKYTVIGSPAKNNRSFNKAIKSAKGKSYECGKCVLFFSRKLQLLQHISKNHMMNDIDPNVITCDLCNLQFCDKDQLIFHLRTHHMVYHSHVCPKCNFKCSNRIPYELHLESNHRHRCVICYVNFVDRNKLDRHVKVSHEAKRYKCELCHYSFNLESSLTKHIETMHLANRSFPCSKCNVSFKREMISENHVDSGSVITRVTEDLEKVMEKCEHCESLFPSIDSLQRHILWEHTQNVTLHKCSRCDAVFNDVEELKDHLQIEHFLIER